MTIAVDLERKATKQTNEQSLIKKKCMLQWVKVFRIIPEAMESLPQNTELDTL